MAGAPDRWATSSSRADVGVNDPAIRDVMVPFLAEVAEIEGVQSLSSPYVAGNEGQVSQDDVGGRIAYAEFEAPSDATFEETAAIGVDIRAAMPDVEGLQIELGGAAFAEFEVPSSEALGLGFAIVILIIAFGSVLAMGLPIGVALAGIVTGSLIAGLLSKVIDMPDFTSTIGVMIGLGVGIDYALFIVTRFRENLHNGHSVEQSTLIAMNTAGRAVVFAGTTVVISLLGMLVMQLGFVSGLAIGAAVVVALTLVASLTLLPALLGFAGERIEVTRRRGLIAAGLVAAALVGVGLGIPALILFTLPVAVIVLAASFAFAPLRQRVLARDPKPRRSTLSYRWSRVIQRRPWTAVLAGGAALVALAVPIFGLRLGFSDEGNYPEDTTTRHAYDLLAEGFGPGFNGPLSLATEIPPGTDGATLQRVTDSIAADPGVAFVSAPITNRRDRPDGRTVAGHPDDRTTGRRDHRSGGPPTRRHPACGDRRHRPRRRRGRRGGHRRGLHRVPVGSAAVVLRRRAGPVVPSADGRVPFAARPAQGRHHEPAVDRRGVRDRRRRLPVGLGWFPARHRRRPDRTVRADDAVRHRLRAVDGLRGVPLSRVREEWDRTGDSRTSVADGLASTARVITAAAAIMVVVFGSFLGESDRIVKLFGLGLSVAVLIDATIVRLLLVPATMELLGDRNWWIPRWLDRILPRVHIEAPPDLDAELAQLEREQPIEVAER